MPDWAIFTLFVIFIASVLAGFAVYARNHSVAPAGPVLIRAATRREAQAYAERHHITRWAYFAREWDLQGRRDVIVHYAPGWQTHSFHVEMTKALFEHEASGCAVTRVYGDDDDD